MMESGYKYLNPNDRQSQQYKVAKSKYLIISSSKDASIDMKQSVDFDYKASQNDTDDMSILFKIKKIKSPKQIICFNSLAFETVENLIRSLMGLFKQPDASGSLLYYNGHGDEEGNWLLQIYDDQTGKVEFVKFELEDLLALWEKRASNMKHLFLIMDSCYAGKWVKTLKQMKHTSISILAACSDIEKTVLINNNGSYFTNFLLWTFVESFASKRKHLVPHRKLSPCSYSPDYSILKTIFNFEIGRDITGWESFEDIHEFIINAPKKKTHNELQSILSRLGFPQDSHVDEEEDYNINPFQDQYYLLKSVLNMDTLKKMQILQEQRFLFKQKISFKFDLSETKDPLLLQIILKMLKQYEYVSVKLSSCQLTEKEAISIINSIVECENAVSFDLDLSLNDLNGKVFNIFCAIFGKYCLDLQEIFLNFNWNSITHKSILPLVNVFEVQKNLKCFSLGLSQNDIGDENLAIVLINLSKMSNLNQVILQFSSCSIGDLSLKALGKALVNLKELQAFKFEGKWNQITCEGVIGLAKGLEVQKDLKELFLDFEFNSIKDTGAKCLLQLIKSSKKLESSDIDVNANQVTEKLYQEIKSVVKADKAIN